MKPGPATSAAVMSFSFARRAASFCARSRGGCFAGFARIIAALVERSPCAGSRGGSTATRVKSRPVGQFAGLHQGLDLADHHEAEMGKDVFHVVAYLSNKPEMFVEREAIGHAGNIIGNHARGLARARPARLALPFGRQDLRLGEQQGEQLLHDAARFRGHAIDAVMAIHPLEEKTAQAALLLPHARRRTPITAAEWPRISAALLALSAVMRRCDSVDDIADHAIDQAADRLMDAPSLLDTRVELVDLGEDRTQQRHVAEIGNREQSRAQPVVGIVIVVGDIVGQRRHLRLGARPGRELEIVARHVIGQRRRQLAAHRAVMFRDPFERLPGEVEPVERGIAPLELGQHAQRLVVVAKAAEPLHHLVQRLFAGMAERRVAEIVGKRQRLGQILVETEAARDAARDLRHFEAVGKSRPVVIALVIDEHLRLVLQAAEGRGMDDAIAVTLKHRAGGTLGLGIEPAAALFRAAGIGGERRLRHGRNLIRATHRCNAARRRESALPLLPAVSAC